MTAADFGQLLGKTPAQPAIEVVGYIAHRTGGEVLIAEPSIVVDLLEIFAVDQLVYQSAVPHPHVPPFHHIAKVLPQPHRGATPEFRRCQRAAGRAGCPYGHDARKERTSPTPSRYVPPARAPTPACAPTPASRPDGTFPPRKVRNRLSLRVTVGAGREQTLRNQQQHAATCGKKSHEGQDTEEVLDDHDVERDCQHHDQPGQGGGPVPG